MFGGNHIKDSILIYIYQLDERKFSTSCHKMKATNFLVIFKGEHNISCTNPLSLCFTIFYFVKQILFGPHFSVIVQWEKKYHKTIAAASFYLLWSVEASALLQNNRTKYHPIVNMKIKSQLSALTWHLFLLAAFCDELRGNKVRKDENFLIKLHWYLVACQENVAKT